jgi:hypothetical protein
MEKLPLQPQRSLTPTPSKTFGISPNRILMELFTSRGILQLTFDTIIGFVAVVTVWPCIEWYLKQSTTDGPPNHKEFEKFIKRLKRAFFFLATQLAVRIMVFCMTFFIRHYEKLVLPCGVAVLVIRISLFFLGRTMNGKWFNVQKIILLLIPRRIRERKTYRHTKIENDREIRLLTLHPRLPFSAIRVSLDHWPLDSAPPYEAMSYTWGTSKETRKISVNGIPYHAPISTFEVLRGRSSPWKDRVLWIDSICINQDDSKEKEKQILLMKDIYSKCSRAIVWLGDSGGILTSLFALSLIRELASASAGSLVIPRIHLRAYSWSALLNLFRIHALSRFLNYPWFERVWVVQEVVLPKKVHMVFGGQYLDWNDLDTATKIFSDPQEGSEMTGLLLLTQDGKQARVNVANIHAMAKIRMSTQIHGFAKEYEQDPKIFLSWLPERDRIKAIMENNMRQDLPLDYLLTSFSHLKATQAVDKVYAILGLITDGSNKKFKPNYTKTPQGLFTELAWHFVESDDPFRVLYCAGIGFERKYEDLPSWVPDWTSSLTGGDLTLANPRYDAATFRASNRSRPKVSFCHEQRQLTVGALYVDEIAHLGGVCAQGDDNEDLVVDSNGSGFYPERNKQEYRWHAEALHLATTYANPPLRKSRDLREAFWRTLATDLEVTTRPASVAVGEMYACWVQTVDLIEQRISEDGKLLPFLADEFWKMTERANRWRAVMGQGCVGRRFCVTKNGYLGLVPPRSEKGDLIWVILGASIPYVIRRKRERKGEGHEAGLPTYQLVGECYVDEMMDGEAIKATRDMENVVLE